MIVKSFKKVKNKIKIKTKKIKNKKEYASFDL